MNINSPLDTVIADNAVTQAKMADNAIGQAEIINNSITQAKMADNAIGQAEIINNSITQAKMADNAIGQAEMADSAIGQAELKSTIQSQSYDIPATSAHVFALTGGEYCFRPTAKGESVFVGWGTFNYQANLTTSYATVVVLYNRDTGAQFGYVIHRYMQASGEVYWIFILRDKITKENIGISACADHPCFGSSQDPEAEPHMFGDAYNPAKHEMIVINPSPEEVLDLQKKTTPNRSVVEVIEESYMVDDTIEPDWPDVQVTVGLPPEWEEKPIGSKITPIKKVIPQPAYIKTATLKLKAA